MTIQPTILTLISEVEIIIKKLLTVRNATCYIVAGKGG